MKKTLALVVALLSGFAISGCLPGKDYVSASYGDVAYAMGLQSGEEYPLVIGERIEGTSGKLDVSRGLFTTNISFNMQPTSGVSVRFAKGDNAWIFEIPMSKITFHQTSDPQETVALNMSNYSVTPGFTSKKVSCDTRGSTWVPIDLKSCEVYYGDDVALGGLGPIVQNGTVGATFTVHSETYDALLTGKK